MSQPSSSSYTRWLLPAIVLVYLILATLYAAYTPDWQAPDEPAHYNYVQYLGEHTVSPSSNRATTPPPIWKRSRPPTFLQR